jgi:UPF0755 protein
MKFLSTKYPRLRVHFDGGTARFTDGELETEDPAAIEYLTERAKHDDTIVAEDAPEPEPKPRRRRQPKPKPEPEPEAGDEPGDEGGDDEPAEPAGDEPEAGDEPGDEGGE